MAAQREQSTLTLRHGTEQEAAMNAMQTMLGRLSVLAIAALAVLSSAAIGEAQTYRFQLEPLCDRIELTFVPMGSPSVLGVVGYDDNCGENPRSPIHGSAVMNPDGSFTIGFTTSLPYSVYGRDDVGLQTNVEIPIGDSVGYWTDDDGNYGTFIYDILDQKSG